MFYIFEKLMQNTVQWSCKNVRCHMCYMSYFTSFTCHKCQRPHVLHIFGKLMQTPVQWPWQKTSCHMWYMSCATNVTWHKYKVAKNAKSCSMAMQKVTCHMSDMLQYYKYQLMSAEVYIESMYLFSLASLNWTCYYQVS